MSTDELEQLIRTKSLKELEKMFGKTQLKDLLFVYDDTRAMSYFDDNFYTCEGEDYEIPDYPDELDNWWDLEDLIAENMSSDDIIEQFNDCEISDLIKEYTDEELIKLGMKKLIKYRYNIKNESYSTRNYKRITK